MGDRIDQEKKDQLLMRIKQCLDEDTFTLEDWMKMYDIMLEACERNAAELQEEIMIERLKEGSEDD